MSESTQVTREPKSGFSMTSLVAVLFATVVFTPAIIYLQLTVGIAAVPTTWFVVLLLVEAFRFGGRRITQQETTLIMLLAGGAGAYTNFIYWAWFAQSDIASLFGFATDQFPRWLVPVDALKQIWTTRTILHPAWIVPIGLSFLTGIIGSIMALSLGYIAKQIFIETEKLPFPMQQVSAQGIITITEGKKETTRYLFSFSTIGFIYGIVLYAIPSITEAWTGRRQVLLPIPWADFSAGISEEILPGAVLGVATDLGPIATAFVLPYNVIFSMAIGSFAIWTVGNTLLVTQNLSPTPWWVSGMNITYILQRSTLYFWAAPIVGIALAAGLMPIMHHPRVLVNAFRSLLGSKSSDISGQSTSGRKFSTFGLLSIVAWLGCGAFGVALYAILAPDFPLWIPLIFQFGMPMIATLISGRFIALTGVSGGGIGGLQTVAFISTGYTQLDAWVMPNVSGYSGTGFLSIFKTLDLTSTTIGSYIKMWVILIPVNLALALLFTQMFWTLAPIPSSTYPATQIYWPIDAINFSVLVRGRQVGVFEPMWILYAFIVGAGVYAISQVPVFPLSALSFPALAAGIGYYPPLATTLLIGTVLRIVLTKYTGKEFWDRYKMIFSAGLMVGQGIAVTIGVGITFIVNSIWTMPY